MGLASDLHEEHKARQERIRKAALKELTTKVELPKSKSIFDIIITEVCAYYKVRAEDILSQRRGSSNIPRHMVIYLLYLVTDYTNPHIAKKMQRDPATITYSLQKTKSELLDRREDIQFLEPRIRKLIAKKQESDKHIFDEGHNGTGNRP